mmetsp:Transcript_9675/g.31678  ORF Transcript_9675/g.31678 Transcript_9675/m.31678 type:complete len:268 (+) Transcript_9675:879-1682(+)
MEELRYGARLSETSVGPCSSGLWQRLTQCSPAWWSCVGSGCVLLPLYYRLQQVDEELGHRRQDVGDEAGREGRGDEAGEQDPPDAARAVGTLGGVAPLRHVVERPEKVGEGQQQRGGGPRVRVRHDAEQGEPVEDEGGKVETHQRGGRAHHRVDIRTAAVDAEDGGVVDPAPLPREEQHPEEDPKVGEEEHRAEEGVVQRRDRLHAGSLGAGDDEADQQHEERAGDAGTEAEGEEGPLEPIHRDLPNLIRAEPVVELEAGDRRDGGL